MTKPKIALIIGSTRATRFADLPAQWMLEQAQARTDMEVELVDLRDYDLPFFDEMASNAWMPSQDAKAVKWQKKLAEFDGYIFVVAEYNRSITGVLKNALDQAYVEWAHKPVGAIAYGSMGGAYALGHLQNIAVELQMVPVRNDVRIGGGDFFRVHPGMGGSGKLSDIEAVIAPSAKAMLDDIVWWAKATMTARAAASPAPPERSGKSRKRAAFAAAFFCQLIIRSVQAASIRPAGRRAQCARTGSRANCPARSKGRRSLLGLDPQRHRPDRHARCHRRLQQGRHRIPPRLGEIGAGALRQPLKLDQRGKRPVQMANSGVGSAWIGHGGQT